MLTIGKFVRPIGGRPRRGAASLYRDSNRLKGPPHSGHRLGGFADRACVWGIFLSEAVDEGGDRGAAVHAAAVMRSFGIVLDEVLIEDGLHLLEGLKPGAAAFDAKMLVEKRAMPTLDNAVGLRPVNPGSLVFDVFELQKQLVRMAVFATAELAAIVGTASILVRCASKVGSTSSLISWTAVSGSLLG